MNLMLGGYMICMEMLPSGALIGTQLIFIQLQMLQGKIQFVHNVKNYPLEHTFIAVALSLALPDQQEERFLKVMMAT